ncbi:hypothetical protein bcCo53_001556 (plasmid) [Borrelia coriaceae]|nr:Vsp/OspC family lipoprotein [Borrelia coriaceae]UPA17362.1 hypothetical protein bcCo53_001556 [Borrelia coriaceae]
MKISIKTFCATLFISLFLSCNNGGPEIREGQVATADGTVIDLKAVSKKIKDTSAFASNVKEIHTLIKSVNELAKAIGKKIQQSSSGSDLADDSSNNKDGRLVSGAFKIIFTVKDKATALEGISEVSSGLKMKITDLIGKSTAFLVKLQEKHSELGKTDVNGDVAKKAIDIANGTVDHGASELKALNTTVDELLEAANAELEASIAELTIPAPSN